MIYPDHQNDDHLKVTFSELDLNEEQISNLVKLYGLSSREGEIARLLYQGLTIHDIAGQQSKALETMRKQAKAIPRKTGTHSQAHLMRIMASVNLTILSKTEGAWHNRQHPIRTLTLNDGRVGDSPARLII